ncbi:MAG: phenylacetate--CoA ligase family protein [Acidobacteria bacterium]|nr:phenylacetate--CoA ligase family protein [Acidobacteriota bacterium]
MTDLKLKIYHHLPPWGRNLAASYRGRQLNSWRYGPETERLIDEARERENWNSSQWKSRSEERLARMLHQAATRVPFYRAGWEERRRRGDRSSWEDLNNWPLLDKESVRENPLAFVSDDCHTRDLYRERTSGTTGKAIDLWWSRDAVRRWFALYELRNRLWHNVSRHQPWAILGGQPVIPATVTKPPFWVWNSAMNQLYLSSHHVSPRNLSAFADAIESYGVTHMIAYSSSAAALAREAADQGRTLHNIKVVITNAEPLFPWQRETIRQGFGCETRETYGMAEIVTAASECEHGRLHLWPEVGVTEALKDDGACPVEPGQAGRLVCTGLLNDAMPLIRYVVGDRGRLSAQDDHCACGRRLPAISAIEGRTNDMLLAKDGRRVYWLNPVFYGLPVREAQIIQESTDLIRVLYVPAPEFKSENEKTIKERLQMRMGDIPVSVEAVASIPRAPNGKFKAVVCNFDH